MVTLVKIMNKDLNLPLLREEMVAAGVPVEGATIAGFDYVGGGQYIPFTETRVISTHSDPAGGPDIEGTADPGELRFRFATVPTAPQEAIIDGVLTAHDATGQSTDQVQRQSDKDAIPILVDRWQSWGTLNNAQKDDVLKNLTRLVARLLDGSQQM